MEQEGFTPFHGVFVGAKEGQAIAEEAIGKFEGLRSRYGIAKTDDGTKVVG